MSYIVVDLLFGIAAALVGAAGASWLWCFHFRGKTPAESSAKARHAAEVLVHLCELATRVAVDVDEHNSQVEEINDELTSVDGRDETTIIDVVAKLIEKNQHMQEKLQSTEDKLCEQAQEIQTYAAQARTDALTLLANRRAFDDELARRIAEFRRHRRGFSLVMADVDRFKKFNDTHGHQLGDEVLRGVARVLRRKMREMDLVARFGGEEFAIILPETNLDDASKSALRAGEAIEKSRFRHDGKELRVTASFGAAEVLGNEDGAMLVARTDEALYAAKEGGRNCVYRHDGETARRVVGNEERVFPEPKRDQQNGISQSKRTGKTSLLPGAAVNEPMSDMPRPLDLDALSGLPCRTTFYQQVRNRTAERKRGGPTFSVLLVEVNQCEQTGGHRGQKVPEAAILQVRRFLAATVREMDVVGHSTGCFALLLPTVGLADAIRMAERIREEFLHYSPAAQDEQAELALSVGVVEAAESDDSVPLLRRAEAALEAATRRGGNRVYYHDGDYCAPITVTLETMEFLS